MARSILLALLALAGDASANTVLVTRVAVLSASLPTGTTFQAESSTNGTTWLPTGVLVAGGGTTDSIRLDGFAETLQYRYVQVGGSGATVTPSVAHVPGLRNVFSHATELRLEFASSLTSNDWSLRRFVFPDISGAFAHVWPAPTQSIQFARSYKPATPLNLATVASSTPITNGGFAGFGPVADDMPSIYRNGFTCAPCSNAYHRNGSNAAAAGESYEFTGPFGVTTAIVADVSLLPPTGTCDSGRSYFDLSTTAFSNVFAESAGFGSTTYRLVPTPVTGNVKAFIPFATTFYFDLRIYNHRAGVDRVEVSKVGSGTWSNLSRSLGNAFGYTGIYPTPMVIRVTSRFGESVVFPPVTNIVTGARFVATNQFTVFPTLEPAPAWILPHVSVDGLTNPPGIRWSAAGVGGAVVNPTNPAAAFQGASGISVTNISSTLILTLTPPRRFPRPPDGALEFMMRSGTTGTMSGIGVRIGGTDNVGTPTNSRLVALPPISNVWRSLRIPLDGCATPARIENVQFLQTSGPITPSLYLDSIFFRQP